MNQNLNNETSYAIENLTPSEQQQEQQQQLSPHAHSKFRQQRLPACRPFLTPFAAFLVYLAFFVVSLVFGIIYFKVSDDIFELKIPYSGRCDKDSDTIGTTCVVDFTVDEDRDGPFYIYYELTNFYQNNFLYGDSKNWDQLRGKSYSKPKNLDSCKPAITSPDFATTHNFSSSVYVPCGAVPKSVFNDTFSFQGEGFPAISSNDISLKTFKNLFKPANSIYADSVHWMNDTLFPDEQTDQHFINWVQLAPFSTFRKLYAKTNEDAHLEKGNYSVVIENNFPVYQFKGTKSLIIAKVKWIGGKNRFFGIFFFTTCGLSGVGAIAFLILYLTNTLPLYKAIKESAGSLAMSLVE